jgi:hypothetical protein
MQIRWDKIRALTFYIVPFNLGTPLMKSKMFCYAKLDWQWVLPCGPIEVNEINHSV